MDVRNGQVVKGVQFRNHEIIGDIVPLAKRYAEEGADELVFYDITASSDGRVVDKSWVAKVAEVIDIPFCVAGGIKTVEDAGRILTYGADKISINSPALANPGLITELADCYGVQCIVVGIDTWYDKDSDSYHVYQFTGDEKRTVATKWNTIDWVQEVQKRGAGEIVLNMMNQEALAQTQSSGKVTFYSRTKQRLWTKGETSGNFLNVVSISSDCDNDTLLILVNPIGPTCHTGANSCFTNSKTEWSFLYDLEQLLASRKQADPQSSYTAKLYHDGTKRIAQKVGEEGVETALAATVHDKEEIS